MATPTNQFRIKLATSTAYNFSVDWGDGMREIFNQTTSSNEDFAGLTHTYSNPSVYSISITQNTVNGFPKLFFNGSNNTSSTNDDVKVIDITQWGSPNWTSMFDAFEGCSNLSAVATDGGASTLSGVTDFTSTWNNCTSLTAFPLIDTSKGTNFGSTWANCTSLTAFPLIDTSRGTNFANTWYNCNKLTSFPTINTLSGTNFGSTWYNCNKLTSFPAISTQNGTTFTGTWSNCTSLTSFSLLDTSKGTNFTDTWINCKGLSATRFDLFNFSKMSNGVNCFRYIKLLNDTYSNTLTGLSASNINSNVVLNAGYSRYNPVAIDSINHLTNRNWTIYDNGLDVPKPSSSDSLIITVDTSKILNVGDNTRSITLPFNGNYGGKDGWDGCAVWIDWGDSSIEFFDQLSTGQPTHVYSVSGIYDIAISQNRPYGITSMSYWNLGADRTKIINIKQFGSSIRFRDLGLAFINASNLKMDVVDPQNSIYITSELTGWLYQTWSSWNGNSAMTSFPPLMLSGVGSMPATWANVTGLTSFGLINCEGTNDLFQAWDNCTGLLSFPTIRPIKCTDFRSAWKDCRSLVTFPYIETPRAIAIGSAWSRCSALRTFPPLILSAVQTCYSTQNNGTGDFGAWTNCTSLTGFPFVDLSNCTDFRQAWSKCYSLSASNFPTLNMSKMTSGADCFNGVKLTTTSYSSLLTSICATNINTNVTFHGGNSKYNFAGQSARSYLISRGWTITDGGFDIDSLISQSTPYWTTNFESGTVSKTSGIASPTDVVIYNNTGSVTTTLAYSGTRSYYCTSMVTPRNGLSFGISPLALNNYNGFIIDFWLRRVTGDTYPTMLAIGLSSRDVWTNNQIYNKNYYYLRWLGTSFGSGMQGTGSPITSNNIQNTTTWGSNNTWNRVSYYYDNLNKIGYLWTDGILRQSYPQTLGWNTLPDGKIYVTFFSFDTLDEQGDNGIEAYIDNLGFYVV
jgi:hypothetical protein